MTNTTSRKLTTARRLNPDTPYADALAGSQFTHPLLVKGALDVASKKTVVQMVGESYRSTLAELEVVGLVCRVQTTSGARAFGRATIVRWELTEEGRERLKRASRAAQLAVLGLL